MDREAANWLAVIERENRTVPLFVRKSSNDIQLGKVANEHDFLSAFAFFLCVYGVLWSLAVPQSAQHSYTSPAPLSARFQ